MQGGTMRMRTYDAHRGLPRSPPDVLAPFAQPLKFAAAA